MPAMFQQPSKMSDKVAPERARYQSFSDLIQTSYAKRATMIKPLF